MNGTSQRKMCTGAWYGDQPLALDMPPGWQVTTYWPSTPVPLTDDELVAQLDNPVGQPPIRELCRGKSRPLILVDDLNRPTPAERIIPLVLRHMQDAGIPPERVTVLMATGTHGKPNPEGLAKKVGPEAASRCRLLVHDCRGATKKIGTTCAGTPVFVNPEVLASDCIVGIGGVYPNYTAGFGGGAKLALGVLSRRSILHLHYGHKSMGGVYDADNPFRRDVTEIAAMIGLNTTISVHVNEARQIVRLRCGDHRQYYSDAVAFSREAYEAPAPGDADVVIANTYPEDLSLLFARMKGFVPLRRAKPGASLIAIGRCPEALGNHGLFPELARTRMTTLRDLIRRIRVMPFSETFAKLAVRTKSRTYETLAPPEAGFATWLYVSGPIFPSLLQQAPGIRLTRSWRDVLVAVEREQGGRKDLKVAIYPCAPLQCIVQNHPPHTASLQMETLTAK
jgi:nickel-dependent lactate racemase